MKRSFFTHCFYIIGCVFFVFSSCKNPTDPEKENNYTSPEEIVEQMVQTYNARDANRYTTFFTADCRFLEGTTELWGMENEKHLHESMFAQAAKLHLDMQFRYRATSSQENVSNTYRYNLKLQYANGKEIQAEGEVTLEFEETTNHGLKISTFQERPPAMKKPVTHSDSVDFFPLQVGNWWIYEKTGSQQMPYDTLNVISSISIRNNLYYILERSNWPGNLEYVRIDSGQYKEFFMEDSSEHTIYDFSSEPGDTTYVSPPNHPGYQVVLVKQEESLTVPAGTFANILSFQTKYAQFSSVNYKFAANIGRIYSYGTNEEYILIQAKVKGVNYPNTTGIKTEHLSWSDVKKRFNL